MLTEIVIPFLLTANSNSNSNSVEPHPACMLRCIPGPMGLTPGVCVADPADGLSALSGIPQCVAGWRKNLGCRMAVLPCHAQKW